MLREVDLMSKIGGLNSASLTGGQSAPATRPLASPAANHNCVERQEETTSPTQDWMETAMATVVEIRKGQKAA